MPLERAWGNASELFLKNNVDIDRNMCGDVKHIWRFRQLSLATTRMTVARVLNSAKTSPSTCSRLTCLLHLCMYPCKCVCMCRKTRWWGAWMPWEILTGDNNKWVRYVRHGDFKPELIRSQQCPRDRILPSPCLRAQYIHVLEQENNDLNEMLQVPTQLDNLF